MAEHFDTVVIGAGQAGLAAGYHLAAAGRPFVVLDAGERIGGSWLHRWDSMRLFTPATYDGLPGMPFRGDRFPTSAAMADYLAAYAEHFGLPVRTGVCVDGLFREGDGFRVTSGVQAFDAANVILATGVHRRPRIPAFAAELAPGIRQLHSGAYRNPGQLQPGTVLVVGAGNSGADIAIEVSRIQPTLLSGRHPGQLPFRIDSRTARVVFPFIWWTWTHVLTENTPPGRKVQAKALEGHGEMLIRLKDADIAAASIERTARIAGVVDGRPQTEDGRILDVANVIWCTGFQADYGWIDLPGLDSSGRLASDRGRVKGQPGLYVLGQEFQHMFNSHTVGGVGRDAAAVVRALASRVASVAAGVPEIV